MHTRPRRLPEALEHCLAARGFRELTPVQRAVLDCAPADADLLVSAPTGSGKTIAFGLALAAHLEPAGTAPAGPRALVIAPTRELARQVAGELGWLLAAIGARVGCCTGGTDPRAERAALRRGPDVVVGSAGRLRSHVTDGALATGAIACMVLDEADDMLSRGFRDDLEFILEATPPGRRTLMFSATITPKVERLAGRYQRDARRLELAGPPRQELLGVVVAPDRRAAAVANLLRLHEARAALVFCARRETVAGLAPWLAGRGFSAVALSGALDQRDRDAAMAAIRQARAGICVATDIAARGLDLPGLDLVVNADLPASPEALLHRAGRSGRAGVPGTVVLVAEPGERRRANRLAERAGLGLAWVPPPGPAAIRLRDLERLLALCAGGAEPRDAEAAAVLLASREPEAVAAALARLWRTGRPDAEPLTPPDPA